MAGTVTVAFDNRRSPDEGNTIQKQIVSWTSDASGNATGTVTLYGWLTKVIVIPGTSGNQPTNNFSVKLVDANSVDALQAKLNANSNASNVETYLLVTGSAVPMLCCGNYTFTVAAAGNTKTGVVEFYSVEIL